MLLRLLIELLRQGINFTDQQVRWAFERTRSRCRGRIVAVDLCSVRTMSNRSGSSRYHHGRVDAKRKRRN